MPDFHKTLSTVRNFLVFSGGSVVGAIIDYVVTLGAHGLLDTPPSLALSLSMVISASVVFLYHDRITFRTSGAGWLKRYVKFMMLAAIVLALRVVILELLIAAALPVFIAVAVAIVVVSVANFAASSMLVFMKGRQ